MSFHKNRIPAHEYNEVQESNKNKGQSLVEFALVSVILFAFLMGIMDAGRLLLTYSAVSNAAQEGSRYAVLRPRDVLNVSEATQIAQNATRTPTALRHTYVPTQVVADGSCSSFSKTREHALGVNSSGVNVATWYDAGDGTPLPVTQDSDLYTVAIPGNRAVVEASYHFDFIVPYMQIFVPNGLDVTIRSARTIMSAGDDPTYHCTVNYTPAPTYTPSPTYTPTNTSTPTSTFTPTPTFTATPTVTPTPVCGLTLTSAYACLTNGNNSTWQAYVYEYGYQLGDIVSVSDTSQNMGGVMIPDLSGGFTYDSSLYGQNGRTGDRIVFTLTSWQPCGPTSTSITFGSTRCGVSTPTPTYSPTNTPTITPTFTRTWTPTWTPTITPTFTRTSTPTNTPTNTFTPTPTITPTYTPTNTKTPTPTNTPSITPTSTNTRTPTITPTFTITPTSTRTPSPTSTLSPTITPTATPTIAHKLKVTSVSMGAGGSGGSNPLDISANVADELNQPSTTATVNVTLSGALSGTYSMTNVSPGVYKACGVAIYSGGSVTASVTASQTGYSSGSGSTNNISGNSLCN